MFGKSAKIFIWKALAAKDVYFSNLSNNTQTASAHISQQL